MLMTSMTGHARVLCRIPVTYRRDRGSSRRREVEPQIREYGLRVVSLQVRRMRFARFVERALRDAQARGMTTAQIEAATRVGSSTIYRWKDGEWSRDPQRGQVKNFCAGLSLSLDEAYRALDWQTDDRETVEPAPIQNPALREAARLLADPSIRVEDKAMILEMLAMLNARAVANRKRADR